MNEMELKAEGVGALIVRGNQFLTVEETNTSYLTQKIIGMRSLVYETLEAGETHLDGLRRALCIEELDLSDLDVEKCMPGRKLCEVFINPGVLLHAYYVPLEIPEGYQLRIGTSIDEVRSPGWDSIEQLLKSEFGNRLIRPGNREVLMSYQNLKLGLLYQPGKYTNTLDRIRDDEFPINF
jgi:hypothetical protein